MQSVRLGDICKLEKGKIGIQAATPGKYPLVTTGENRLSHNEYHFEGEAVCIPLVSGTGHGHASIKRLHYQDGKFAVGSILVACVPIDNKKISAKFLYLYLSLLKDEILVPLMQGSANVSLKIKDLQKVEIPNISFKEQCEIVALFEILEVEHQDIITEISRQSDYVVMLRQTIFQEAARGKIVPRDSNDKTAVELLTLIRKEKQKLINSKKITTNNILHQKSKQIPPFEIPDYWEWVRLWDIAWCFRGHNPPKSEFSKEPKLGYVRFIQITDFKTENHAVYVPFSKNLKMVTKGEILMAAYRHIGKLSRSVEGAFNVALCKINNIEPFDRDYLELLIHTDLIKGELLSASERGHIPSMHSEHLLSLWVPVPPLKEQKRIVTKVNELMQLCKELEREIENSRVNAQRLLQTVLKEAFDNKKSYSTKEEKLSLAAEPA